MTLAKLNPSKEMIKMEKGFNSLLNRFFGKFDSDKNMDEYLTSASWSPLSDIVETKDSYLVNLDIPGVDKKDIKISYENGRLTVCGERKEEKEKKETNYYSVERNYGKYYRSFNLPKQIKHDLIDAELKNGSLKITVPKSEEVKEKQIEIKVN